MFYICIMVAQINPIVFQKYSHKAYFSSKNQLNFCGKKPVSKSEFDFNIYGNDKNKSDLLFNDRLIDFDKIIHSPLPVEISEVSEFSFDDILKILERSKNLTLQSGSLLKKHYDKKHIYDFPLLFATACYNSRDLGQGRIINKIPDLFKGIDPDRLFTVFDTYSTACRDAVEQSSAFKISINGKSFYFKSMGKGSESNVFKISDGLNGGNSVIFKVYNSYYTFAPAWFYGNTGLMREANMAGVADVPQLYFANPVLTYSNIHEDYKGCWAIIEDASQKTLQEGLMLKDWLNQKGLLHKDDRPINRVNGFCVDLGFVMPLYCPNLYNSGWVDYCANDVYSRYYIDNETTQDLIDYLRKTMV